LIRRHAAPRPHLTPDAELFAQKSLAVVEELPRDMNELLIEDEFKVTQGGGL
jgi:hypothetical protein